MRWFYILVFVVFVLVVLIFAFQNLQVVTVTFVGFSVQAPIALVAVAVYILGMLTGSSLLAALRRSWAATRGY
jgi:uncharacterized integral membrane protein